MFSVAVPYRKVLILQTICTIVFALIAFIVAGRQAVWSVLNGGAVILLGNLAYAFVARPSRLTAKSGSTVLITHVLAQLVKLGLILCLMLAALASGELAAGWFVAAIGVALLGHVLSLFPLK